MKQRILAVLILSTTLFMSGCAEEKKAEGTQLSAGLTDRVMEAVLENDGAADEITAADVVIDQMCYGSFSQPEAEEVLVICKILNMPHVGGLDRRAIVISAVDTMDVVAYDEISADEVWVYSLPMSNGQDRIIFSGKTTYQGISSQNVMFFAVQGGQWTEVPIDALETIGDGYFYFPANDVLIATSGSELTDPSEITAILTWDPDAGQFIPEYSSENTNALSESEIIGFNTGFFNSQTDIMNNMLLSSEYSNPGEIDLFQLFYNGIGGTAEQISTEELELLTEMDSAAPNLDIVKITADEMEAFLQERLGIGLEGTQKTGLDNFYYLEEYDSYYVIAGDTNFEWCTIISGIWESDHILRLKYTKESEEGQWEVTLQKVGDGYLFVSNVRASQ